MMRVAIVGQMVGRNPGHVTTQGELLADGLEKEGYPVISVSSLSNRYLRLVDIINTLIFRKSEIDLLCLQVYSGSSFLIADIASRLGEILKKPIIMVLHGGALPEFISRFPRWTCRVLGRAGALIAPSAFLARAMGSYGFQIQVIPNIINLSHYPYRHRQVITPRLFWMRTFHPIYNPFLAVRVMSILKKKFPAANLIMAGQSGPLEMEVKKMAEKLGVANSVCFVGFVDMATKTKIGHSSEIFLNTNHVDNMPVSVVEACAMGLPVVATSVGGVPDLLRNGETGLLVPDNDDQAMGEAVFNLLANSSLTGRLSANGRQLASQSSWENTFPQWKKVFYEVMDKQEN